MSDLSFAVLPLDPGRAVPWLVDEVDSAAGRDQSIRRAKALLEERIGDLPDADREVLAAILWAWLKNYLLSQPLTWPPFGVLNGTPPALLAIKHGLVNGSALLSAVEAALDTSLSADTLRRVSTETRDLVASDARRTGEMDVLRDELNGGTDVTPQGAAAIAVALVAGVALGWGAAEVYHHHIAHND